MVNQIDSKLDFAPETPQPRLSTRNRASDRSRHNRALFDDDDLLATLANKYENRCARQVSEWERMRRQNFPAAV